MNIDRDEILKVYKSINKYGPIFVDGGVNKRVLIKNPEGIKKLMAMFREMAEYFAGYFKIKPWFQEEFIQESIITALKSTRRYKEEKSNPYSFFYAVFKQSFHYNLRRERDKSERRPNICSIDLLMNTVEDKDENTNKICKINTYKKNFEKLQKNHRKLNLIKSKSTLKSITDHEKLKDIDDLNDIMRKLERLAIPTEKVCSRNIISNESIDNTLKNIDMEIDYGKHTYSEREKQWIKNLHKNVSCYCKEDIKSYINDIKKKLKRHENILSKGEIKPCLKRVLNKSTTELKDEIAFIKNAKKFYFCPIDKKRKQKLEFEKNRLIAIKERNLIFYKIKEEEKKEDDEKTIFVFDKCYNKGEAQAILKDAKSFFQKEKIIMKRKRLYSNLRKVYIRVKDFDSLFIEFLKASIIDQEQKRAKREKK